MNGAAKRNAMVAGQLLQFNLREGEMTFDTFKNVRMTFSTVNAADAKQIDRTTLKVE